MIVEEWDYLGHEKLDGITQEYWNLTLQTKINKAIARLSKEKYNWRPPNSFNILISSEKLELFNDYILNSLSFKRIEIVKLLTDNDNIYISIYNDLHNLDENNCAIVKILNYN